jgi:hypothetical protein
MDAMSQYGQPRGVCSPQALLSREDRLLSSSNAIRFAAVPSREQPSQERVVCSPQAMRCVTASDAASFCLANAASSLAPSGCRAGPIRMPWARPRSTPVPTAAHPSLPQHTRPYRSTPVPTAAHPSLPQASQHGLPVPTAGCALHPSLELRLLPPGPAARAASPPSVQTARDQRAGRHGSRA